jgi:hypothetical protein
LEGNVAKDDGSETEILDGTKDAIDRLGLRVEYPKSIYWAESGAGGIRVWKNELWLPRELRYKLDNWMWKGLVTSALAWRELSKRKLVLIRQFLPISVAEAGLLVGLLYYSTTHNFSPFLAPAAVLLFPVFVALGTLDSRRYMARVRFSADERAASIVGRANLIATLKRVQLMNPAAYMYYGLKMPGPSIAKRIARLEKKL